MKITQGHLIEKFRASVLAVFTFSVFALMTIPPATASGVQQRTYQTPGGAFTALIAAVKSGSIDPIVRVLGPQARVLVQSGDEIADEAIRNRFLAAYEASNQVVADGDARRILVIGHEEYPFPIPLIREKRAWRFDSKVGAEEILNRRIGENEHHTIQTMLAYVAAQGQYAASDRDGKGPQYARRLLSKPGSKDGLYWPTAEGEPQSPLGPLIAEANAEGYRRGNSGETSIPYHGYLFRLLTKQSDSAKGGARDFIVNGRMVGGFGVAAAPAEYGNSGVMSFIVNHDGTVYQADLGPGSRRIIARTIVFDPKPPWKLVNVE